MFHHQHPPDRNPTRAILLIGILFFPSSVLQAQAVIQGRVTLPKARPSVVVNQRYEIVVQGGVLTVHPPLAVVYLEGNFPASPTQPIARVEQKGLLFHPAILPIRAGTRVEFPNLDDTYHNIFSYSAPKRFDLGRYRPDDRPIPSQVFDVPGLVTLRCDIHEHMRALILVLDTPHFVVTDADGRFRLEGLPTGSYVLKAWLDSRTTRAHAVVLTAGEIMTIDFP